MTINAGSQRTPTIHRPQSGQPAVCSGWSSQGERATAIAAPVDIIIKVSQVAVSTETVTGAPRSLSNAERMTNTVALPGTYFPKCPQ